jgi:hypothetical protein
MNVFTDDDMKKIRELFGPSYRPIASRKNSGISIGVLRSIIARLEAAEKIPQALDYMRDPEDRLPIHEGPELDELNANIEAWHKAAGKDQK